ncbi:MAG: hypothetical protein ACK4LQ_12855 [Pararhodobacter sp.]
MTPEFKHHRPAAKPVDRPLESPAATTAGGLPVRGFVALLMAGALVLGAAAVAGRVYWAEEKRAAATDEAAPPAVWLAAFSPAGAIGFADGPPEQPLPVFPRVQILTRLSVTVADVPPPPPNPPMVEGPTLALPDAGVQPEEEQVVWPRVVFTLPPRRPAVPQFHLALPGQDGAAPAQPEILALSDSEEPGLTRSLLPRPRPAAIMQLASAPVGASAASLSAAPDTTGPVAGGQDRCEAALTRAIPSRPARAAGGQAFLAGLAGAGGGTRDDAIAQAIMAGNLPEFQRRLVPVTLSGTSATGQALRVTLCVMPDYLAIGADNDFVRVPLGLRAASRIAERFDMALPTTRMVDAIHAQAGLRLTPEPMTPGPQMASTDYFLRHNATLERQRQAAGAALGVLVSGHKKDLVLTNRLARNPGRVAIYGWHRASGQPIQPLSTVHGAAYADYSHGIRLISRRAYVNGRAIDLRELLADSRYAGLLSDEGPIAQRLLLAALN